MGLGVITAACCIVRTVLNWQTVHSDQTWVGIDNYMWRAVEVNLGIGCACAPTLLPLARSLKEKLASVSSANDSKPGIFSRLQRARALKKDQNSDRKRLAPYLSERHKRVEKKGFFKHQDSGIVTYPDQIRTGTDAGRGILVQTDLSVRGQAMEMERFGGGSQIRPKNSIDGSNDSWDTADRWEIENRV